jgi:uncharacterized membrane protein YbhN (UPF0104 family)
MDSLAAHKVNICNHLDIFNLIFALKFCMDFAALFKKGIERSFRVPCKIQIRILRNLIKLPNYRLAARLPAFNFCDKIIKFVKA